jgi:hypothetical protein
MQLADSKLVESIAPLFFKKFDMEAIRKDLKKFKKDYEYFLLPGPHNVGVVELGDETDTIHKVQDIVKGSRKFKIMAIMGGDGERFLKEAMKIPPAFHGPCKELISNKLDPARIPEVKSTVFQQLLGDNAKGMRYFFKIFHSILSHHWAQNQHDGIVSKSSGLGQGLPIDKKLFISDAHHDAIHHRYEDIEPGHPKAIEASLKSVEEAIIAWEG